MRAFNAGRDAGGQGICEVQIVFRKRLLPIIAVEMDDSQFSPGSAQQYAQDRGHGAVMDALGLGKLRVALHAAAQDRFALIEAALRQTLAEIGTAARVAATRGQSTQV